MYFYYSVVFKRIKQRLLFKQDYAFSVFSTKQTRQQPQIIIIDNNLLLDIMNKYEIEKMIGRGAFGLVYLAHLKSDKTQKRALKYVEKAKLQNDRQLLVYINREAEIMKQLKHKNIIHLYEFIDDANDFIFVMEFCNGGNLRDLLLKKSQSLQIQFRFNLAFKIMKQVIMALAYTESLNIMHRDIKPQNILINFIAQEDYDVKVADFGFAKKQKTTSILGTEPYTSPQLWMNKPYIRFDQWSFGVMIVQLLTTKIPFVSKNRKQFMKKIYETKFDFHKFCLENQIKQYAPISQNAFLADLLSKIFVKQEDRLQFKQIAKHPFFIGNSPGRNSLCYQFYRYICRQSGIYQKEGLLQNKQDGRRAKYYLLRFLQKEIQKLKQNGRPLYFNDQQFFLSQRYQTFLSQEILPELGRLEKQSAVIAFIKISQDQKKNEFRKISKLAFDKAKKSVNKGELLCQLSLLHFHEYVLLINEVTQKLQNGIKKGIKALDQSEKVNFINNIVVLGE